MSARGQFLEISIPTDDIRASLEFYQRLGFTELPVNDIRSHYYAVVTDGRVAIGLHAGGYDETTLSFVWPDVARRVRALAEAGHEFSFVELGVDEFNEAGICSPDGHALRFMEARTFSRLRFADAPPTVIGHTVELSLRCADYGAAIEFWEAFDFVTDEEVSGEPSDGESVTLRAPGISLGLRADFRWAEPALRLATPEIQATLQELERRAITRRRSDDAWLIVAPEGTRLLLVDEE